jgi:hypothetical protein
MTEKRFVGSESVPRVGPFGVGHIATKIHKLGALLGIEVHQVC